MSMVYGVAKEDVKRGDMVCVDIDGRIGLAKSTAERNSVEAVAFGPPMHIYSKCQMVPLKEKPYHKFTKVELINKASVAEYDYILQSEEVKRLREELKRSYDVSSRYLKDITKLNSQVVHLREACGSLVEAVK